MSNTQNETIFGTRNFSLFEVNQNGHIMFNNGNCLLALKLSELEKIKKAVDTTIKHRKDCNIDDSIVEQVNSEKHEEVIKKMMSTVTPSKKVCKPVNFIYLAQNTETKSLKIGCSKQPKERLKSLNLSSDVKIIMLSKMKGSFDLEKKLHEKYDSLRLNSEWFSYSDDIINEFKNK